MDGAPRESLFDRSAEYGEMLARGLRLSGEDRDFFVRGRVRELSARLPAPPRRILDFGCGIGETSAHFAECFPEAEVRGVDTAENAIAFATRTHGSARVRFGRVADLGAEPPFELAYANGVFHHIPPAGRVDALRAIWRALVPGGRFAFFENNPWNPGTRLVMHRIPFDRDAIPISPRVARRLLCSAGFRELAAPRFLFWFPRFLAPLRRLEPALARIPLGAQYFFLATRS
jgi:trans-aconitate methyltransferase